MFPFAGPVDCQPARSLGERQRDVAGFEFYAWVTVGCGISATFVIVAPSGVATKKLWP